MFTQYNTSGVLKHPVKIVFSETTDILPVHHLSLYNAWVEMSYHFVFKHHYHSAQAKPSSYWYMVSIQGVNIEFEKHSQVNAL